MLAEVATVLSVTGLAFLGIAMLNGRFPLRQSLGVVVGCFVLLGAPSLASNLMTVVNSSEARVIANLPPSPPPAPRQDLQPATEDPYAGA